MSDATRLRLVVEGLGAMAGPTDGAARYTLGLASALARRDDVAVAAVVGPSISDAACAIRGLERLVVLPGATRGPRLVSQHLAVPLLARRYGADAVIYTGNYVPLLPGPPAVVVVQNLLLALNRPEYGRARALYRRWSRWHLQRRADVVVPISQVLADALGRAGQGKRPSVVVHPGVDVDFFGRPASPPDDAPEAYFLAVGAAWRYRDYGLAVEALAASGLPHALVIVGDVTGEMRGFLENVARATGLDERLRLVGPVSDADVLHGWYAGAAALVCTSAFEAFALGACEAMAAGTPVVAVRRTVYPEVLDGAGLLVEPTAPAVAAALSAVLEPATRRSLRDAGLQRASELSWDRSAERLVDLCLNVSDAVPR